MAGSLVKPRPRAHPFACVTAQLRTALSGSGIATTLRTRHERELTLLLPSLESDPQRSLQFLRADDETEGVVASPLEPWVPPALSR